MMVKLIASDIDGTLLQNNARAVSPIVIEFIRRLSSRGVVFVAASGRQYSNLRRLFKPVQDDIAYICENGSLIMYNGRAISKTIINRELGEELLDYISSLPDCEFLLSGENYSYINPKDDEYKDYIENGLGNDTKVIEKYDEADEDFIKISVYCKDGIDKYASEFKQKWGGRFKATVSGKCWFDFVPLNVNKGAALKRLMDEFNVDFEDTMCFGDSYNDMEMFDVSYYSYAISSADREIRNKARFITPNVESILFDVEIVYNNAKNTR